MKTKYLLLCLVSFGLVFSSCKKKAEEQAEDVVTKMLVKNPWKVTKFTEAGTDITTSFASYICQFFDNHSMTAINSSVTPSTTSNGTWSWDLSTLTFMASFPSAVTPVNKINGTWIMTGTGTTSASKTISKFARANGSAMDVMELTEN
jgi:hypothetical protein